jgi:hypothetical protein
MRNALTLAAVTLVVALTAAPALAQTLTGSIGGVVSDEQGAVLPGVTVTLMGPRGTQNQVTDETGTYRFLALEPGTYSVSADLSGFQPANRGQLVISAGRNLEVDLSLRVGGLAENLTVVGEAPVVDTKSSSTDTTLSQELLYSAPITRTAINVLNYAPGINSDSAYGGDSDTANALMIDGVDTRDPSGGTPWSFYNYNIVEEFQFQGLGAPAEYGGFTGAVVNTITKSGGNRFSGLFDVFHTNDGLGSNNVPDEVAEENPGLADPDVVTKFWDLTTQLGGPIQQNKLFFFGSAQRFLLERDIAGPVTRRHEVSPRLNGKLTWQPTPNSNFTGHLQYDAYNIIGRAGVDQLIATDNLTNREDAPEYLWLLQYRHIFGANTFAEVKYTGWWGFYDLNPEVDEPLTGHPDGSYTGGQGWFYYADRDRNQVNASISHYADGFGGRHELKFGAEFERSKTRDRYGYTDDIYYYDYYGYLYGYSYSYDITAHNRRQSLFAQDSWRVGDKLTINAGVRGDFIQGTHADLGTVYSSVNWAPRLGVAWDLGGDHRTVVKGSYGQYVEGAQTFLFTRAVPGISDTISYFINPDGTREVLDIDPASPYRVADDIKHPRVDEFTLAFERALSADTRLVVTGIFRDNKNFVNSVNPAARWRPITVENDLNGDMTLYFWDNRTESNDGSNYIIRNIEGFQYLDPGGGVIGTADPFRKYRAVMFVLSKRYTNRWQAQVSYVFSKTTGNVDNTGSGQIATRQFETPNLALVNAEGRVTYDRPHEFKLLGSYQIPVIETSVNAYFRAMSGRNYTPFQQFSSSTLNTTGSSSSYRQPNLEPLGSRRVEALASLDLRLEKTFTVGNDRFGIYFDIENLTNASRVTERQDRVPDLSITLPLPDGGVTSFDLPFEAPTELLPARQIRIGGRWSF